MRTLIGPLLFDVGTCPLGSCAMKSYLSYFGCPDDGYICPVTETRQADLEALGTREYQYVTKCVCCKDMGVPIKVHVKDGRSDESLGKISIHFNGTLKGMTDEYGILESSIDSTERSLAITAKDVENKTYLEAVRVFEISDGNRGPFDFTLYMIIKADAIEIDSMIDKELSLSADPTDPDTGNAAIVFKANSFIQKDGSQYNGQVLASITVIDPNNDQSDLVPGNFLTYDPITGTQENLISDGIFALYFTDDNGEELTLSKPVTVKVKDDMVIWKMNSASGLWELAENHLSDSRKKRQTGFTREYLIDIANDIWVNIDAIYNAPRCYFKARIFDQISGVEITSSSTASFRPDIFTYTNSDRLLNFYYVSTNTPTDTCFEVRCPEEGDQYDPLIGFISMLSIESVSVGNIYVPHITRLIPKHLFGYSPTVWGELNAVQYAITLDGLDVFVKFVSDAGPFYLNRTACENSEEDKPDLHFFKPALPSYAEVPDDVNECTARLAFRDVGNFHNYIENISQLPNVTGLSIWVEDGQTYHYKHTTQLQQSDNTTGDFFVFACLKYRCSETGELTIVNLNIDMPSNITVENMNENGDNVTDLVISCYGECIGPLCFTDEREQQEAIVSGIEGSFEAPVVVSSGPDFYDSETTGCNDQTGPAEGFAYEFNCYSFHRNQNVFA